MVIVMNETIDRVVDLDLEEWDNLVLELSRKEEELQKLNDEYSGKEFEIVYLSDIDFKALYGSTAEKVRKQHASTELKSLKDKIDSLELSINYITRRLVFLREVVQCKRLMMEVQGL